MHIYLHIFSHIFLHIYLHILHTDEPFTYYAYYAYYFAYYMTYYIPYSAYSKYYIFRRLFIIHILHILHLNNEKVLASGVSFFSWPMLIAWSPMTGPSCSHTTTDIRHGRPVSYHNLRLESQPIPLASGRGSFQYCPPGPEEAAPVWRKLE